MRRSTWAHCGSSTRWRRRNGGSRPNPSPEELARWRMRPAREHPLVWTHRSGRKSLVLGTSADYVVGMDLDEGRALLADLLDRATRPGRVYSHHWSVGDTVIWDNRGVLHRATPYDANSSREMLRTTVLGDEPIPVKASSEMVESLLFVESAYWRERPNSQAPYAGEALHYSRTSLPWITDGGSQ